MSMHCSHELGNGALQCKLGQLCHQKVMHANPTGCSVKSCASSKVLLETLVRKMIISATHPVVLLHADKAAQAATT